MVALIVALSVLVPGLVFLGAVEWYARKYIDPRKRGHIPYDGR